MGTMCALLCAVLCCVLGAAGRGAAAHSMSVRPSVGSARGVPLRGTAHCVVWVCVCVALLWWWCVCVADIGFRIPAAKTLYHTTGCNVLMVDYRGYGNSDGTPSERGLQRDAQACLDFVLSRRDIDHSKIFVFGQSLGGGVATDLTFNNQNIVTPRSHTPHRTASHHTTPHTTPHRTTSRPTLTSCRVLCVLRLRLPLRMCPVIRCCDVL